MHESVDDSALYGKTVLTVPGIGNSGPDHWQSHWEAQNDAFVRVQQRDWDNPVLAEWVVPLEAAVRSAGRHVFIAAHSLGCLLVTHWLAHASVNVCGALLVAVPDPNGQNFPARAAGFGATAMVRLPCPTIVVASVDDPYADIGFAQRCAEAWGSRFVNVGKAGHINAASCLGQWTEGKRLLQGLVTAS
ncbi:MAG: RBBP9/YdeN family alpha/beta hydrolase [Steroidobacteraceae bacterium]